MQMVLQRERLDLSPVFSTAMQHEGHRLGYIRLASFSQKAASDMRRAIDRLEVQDQPSAAARGLPCVLPASPSCHWPPGSLCKLLCKLIGWLAEGMHASRA